MTAFKKLFDWLRNKYERLSNNGRYDITNCIFLVRASSKKEALEKYAIKHMGIEKISHSKWVTRDGAGKKYDVYAPTVTKMIKKTYPKPPKYRLEIKEVKIKPDEEIQLLFFSKEKKIE